MRPSVSAKASPSFIRGLTLLSDPFGWGASWRSCLTLPPVVLDSFTGLWVSYSGLAYRSHAGLLSRVICKCQIWSRRFIPLHVPALQLAALSSFCLGGWARNFSLPATNLPRHMPGSAAPERRTMQCRLGKKWFSCSQFCAYNWKYSGCSFGHLITFVLPG